MKKAIFWINEEGREVGKLLIIDSAEKIDNWKNHRKQNTETYPINEKITDKPVLNEIVTANPEYYFKINEIEASDEYWSKEGEENASAQPMTQPSWSNGEDVVYDVNDIPTTADEEGNPQLDPSYVYIAPVADESWTYHPAVEAGWEIVEDTEAIAAAEQQAALKNVVQAAINFGQQLLVEFAAENIELGITQDGMTKAVRQKMSEITSALQTGSLYDAIDEIDAIAEEDKDDKYITDERLAEYKQKILDYLA
jgi:hypothetical protein